VAIFGPGEAPLTGERREGRRPLKESYHVGPGRVKAANEIIAGVIMGSTLIPNLTINPETPDLSGMSFPYCIHILEDFDRHREKEKRIGFPSFIHFMHASWVKD
jgi:hypothetical protein